MKPECTNCLNAPRSGHKIVRFGHFFRKSDSRKIQRFKCLVCGRHYSAATRDDRYRQKKRRINPMVFKLLAHGMSMRDTAWVLGIHRTTVARKKRFWARRALKFFDDFRARKSVSEMQFDDMESFEHTKLKPLSLTVSVEKNSRLILGFRVSEMPAKGLLAKKSVKKYGHRKDRRKQAREELFQELKPILLPSAMIQSDENPHYRSDVRRFFPHAIYKTTKGRRGCVVGQGELKRGGFDPIFSLNHTCAMFRAHVNRLFRRTWCTTKLKERLFEHMAIYAMAHNLKILQASG